MINKGNSGNCSVPSQEYSRCYQKVSFYVCSQFSVLHFGVPVVPLNSTYTSSLICDLFPSQSIYDF